MANRRSSRPRRSNARIESETPEIASGAPTPTIKPETMVEPDQTKSAVKKITFKIGGKKGSISSEGGASVSGPEVPESAPLAAQRIQVVDKAIPGDTPNKGYKKKKRGIIHSPSPIPSPAPSESPLTEEETSEVISPIPTTSKSKKTTPGHATKSLHSIKTTPHLASKSIPVPIPTPPPAAPTPKHSSPPSESPPPKAPTPPPTSIPAPPIPSSAKPTKGTAVTRVKSSKQSNTPKPTDKVSSPKASTSTPSLTSIPKTKTKIPKTTTTTPVPAVASTSSTPLDQTKKRSHTSSAKSAKPNPPAAPAPSKAGGLLAATFARLIQPTSTSTPGKTDSSNSFKKAKLEPAKAEKPSQKWVYVPTPEEQAEYDSHAPRRDAERAKRIAQAKNGMNLNFARDTYKLDALNRHHRDIDFNGAMGIETSGVPERIMVHLFGNVVPHGERKRAEAAASAAAASKAKEAREKEMEVESRMDKEGEEEQIVKGENESPRVKEEVRHISILGFARNGVKSDKAVADQSVVVGQEEKMEVDQ